MFRKIAILFLLVLSFALLVPTAYASPPIQIPTEEVAKLKFVNYENWHDVGDVAGLSTPGDGIINTGDYFEGILNIEAITNIPGNIDFSAQLGTKEVTGHFKLHVAGGHLLPGQSGHLDFKLLPGDFIKYYVGEGGSKNWAPEAPDAIARATDGTLWASITDQTFYEGLNDTGVIGGQVFSQNRNWTNLTINNTGYAIIKQLYSSTANEPSFHFVDSNNNGTYEPGIDLAHGDHYVDVYFASRLFENTDPANPNWQFRSEDPAYLWATSTPPPCLSIKKQISVDGGQTWHDADTVGTAPSVPAPHSALYQIIVTNCGTVDLTNVKVSDPTLGITDYPVGDLAAGASKTLTAGDIPALDQPRRCEQPGDFENIAYTQGTDPTGAVVGPVNNPAWLVCSAEPAVKIIKKTNGADANNPDGADVPNIVPGATVTWTYEVTNIGNVSVPMAQVVVTDSQPGVTPVYTSGDNGNNMLDPGETWLYTASGVAIDLMLPPPVGVNVQSGVCSHNQTETPRTAYVNLGKVTIPGASATDPSSYCNPLASLGDFVWEDKNNNGIQDAGEPGIPGVTVKLLDCNGNVLATTSTNASGLYLFSKLLPGNYNVQFVLPAGYVFSPQDQGSDDAKDSDANPSTGMTVCTTLDSGENDLTWDAGMVKTVCLGDFVWEDKNNNGIQDAGEPGIAGVTVKLLDCNGNLVTTTTTDANGYYLFCGLRPGEQYQVEFVTPAGYAFSPQDQGGDDTKDSDANTSTGRTICITMGNTDDLTRDAGMVKTVCLGDFVWEDKNNNGIQDAGEPGIAGVTVKLLDCNGNLVATTTTDANGLYKFCGLRPGEQYQVEFVTPAGYVFSPQDQGGDDTKDSDANTSTGRTICITMGNTDDLTRDAGMVKTVCLGDFVWEDKNNNGIQDAGEPGIAGVTVKLLDCNGNLVATTTTDANGLYKFCGLRPGEQYQVEFVTPAGYVFSPQDQGGDDTRDSDANTTTGRTICITMGNTDDLTRDAGMVKTVCLGDFVWEDKNNNGIQDAGEPGIAGVTVKLLDCNGNLVATTTTDANGLYKFCGLRPGEKYQVEFVKPSGYVFSLKDQGANDAVDSDADTTTGRTVCITIGNTDDLTWDAGMVKPLDCNIKVNKTCAVTQKPKSFDCNSSKPIDKVYLKHGGSKKISSYKVYVGTKADSTKLCDQGSSSINIGDPFTLQCTNTSLQSSFNSSSSVYMTFKFSDGTTGTSIFDKSGSDADMNGEDDCGKSEGNGTSTSTSYHNKWSFNGMHGSKGDEFNCSSPPPPAPFPTGESCEATGTSNVTYGYTITNFGDTALVSSVMDDKLGQIDAGPFTLLPGETKQFTKTATISTTTTNVVTVTSALANGQPCTASDSLTVKIFAGCVYTQGYWKTHSKYGPAGPRDAAWDLVTPSGEDSMFFDTGKTWYQAFWTNPAGNAYWILAHQYMAARLNELNGADTSAIQVALAHAQDLLDTYDTNMGAITGAVKDDFVTTAYFLDQYNNGLVGPPHCDDKEPLAKIGDFVWNDANKNGIQDSGETGVKGIIVKLFDCADNYVAQTATDTYGKYSFTVLPGSYYVQFILPNGYNFTLKDQGSNDAKDSDANTTTGKTACTFLSPGQVDLNWDAGIYMPSTATIGDFVWKDLDKDGIQDSGEPGIKDVVVTLYNCNGGFVATTMTNASGYYYFTVSPGSYYVKFTLPLGYAFSPKDKGGDDTKDSDADITNGKTVCVTLSSGQTDLKWDAGMYEVKSVCTYTQGYWKTHSKYGPAPYDDAWSKVGEDTTFFTTAKSWFDAFWYSPAGNAYWILAHQYEAAYLNGLNGADLTVVNSTMTHAYDLLTAYANNMAGITGSVKDDFTTTAGELDRYNNGLIGPGHCADEKPLTCE